MTSTYLPQDFPTPTEVSIAINFESGLGAEEDIADKRICDWGNYASLSNCVPNVMRMDTGNDDEGSGSKK
ncbi:hypothetical protein K503DRAFT_777081 [Rhizopogon vinicolor AM-OR11-026]|uniref:Uncharacterized protein n=1 Tax=Rhizopogon vinicolor AM-OR11-026 TaxID=1314800 RepID=A0A1B7MHE3_9AGAM|nr:hypothetical protein K503DRAFT_777081 [Rhizopogon vinicolor AM-OR11-026]